MEACRKASKPALKLQPPYPGFLLVLIHKDGTFLTINKLILTYYYQLKPLFPLDFRSFSLMSFFCSRTPSRKHVTLLVTSPQGTTQLTSFSDSPCSDDLGALQEHCSDTLQRQPLGPVMLFSGLDWVVSLREED